MMFQKIRHLGVQNIAFLAGLATAASIFGAGLFSTGVVNAASNCAPQNNSDSNSIIYCGFSSPSAFVSKVKSNNSGNGHNDLKDVYAHFGLEPADYDRFVTSARQGQAYSDGRIVVDGQTVATGGKSIGRLRNYQGPDPFTMPISVNGKNVDFYGNTNKNAFAPGVSSLPVEVLFNSKGEMQFAVLDSCGNPEFGSNVTPSYSCRTLNVKAVSGKANTYQFNSDVSTANNASLAKVVYDFGDGSSATESNPSTIVTHTYTKGGSFTAKVTVYVKLPGNQQVTATSATCQKVITVQIPFYQCLQLNGAIIDQSKMSFTFVATAKYGGGATFTGADFDFGDGNKAEGVKPSAGAASISVAHSYATANTYNATATLHFNVNGKDVTAAACPAMVTPTAPPTPECKPGIPVGSSECNQCPTDSSLPADSPDCNTPPPSLPNTGAGDTIAIFAAVAIAGFLVYRQLVFRKHKAAFTAAQQGTSPLPLGDPLNQEDPLANTPLEPQHRRHHRFHRRRQY